MLARLLRRILATELAVYGALVLLLKALAGWSVAGAVALAVALALLGRTAYVLTAFALARAAETPETGGRPGVACVLGEVGALVAIQSLRQPLMPWIERLAPRPVRRGPPVVLVHGYCCNAAFWLPLRRRLAHRGWRNQYVLSLEPVFASIDEHAEQLAGLLERVNRENPGHRPVVVGHSMGGLVARACLRAAPTLAVERLITLGTPHHGTGLARFGLGVNARQMALNSAWLNALNEDPSSRRVPIVAFGSPCDELVAPRCNAFADFAERVTVEDTGHLRLGTAAAVCRRLLRYLDGPTP